MNMANLSPVSITIETAAELERNRTGSVYENQATRFVCFGPSQRTKRISPLTETPGKTLLALKLGAGTGRSCSAASSSTLLVSQCVGLGDFLFFRQLHVGQQTAGSSSSKVNPARISRVVYLPPVRVDRPECRESFRDIIQFPHESQLTEPRAAFTLSPFARSSGKLDQTAQREPTTRAGGYKSALDGLIIRNMHILNAGGECIRLRGKHAWSRRSAASVRSLIFCCGWRPFLVFLTMLYIPCPCFC